MATQMNAIEATNDDLFKTPDLKPRLKMWKYQWIGIPLILIIPILAMMGVFGKKIENLNMAGGGLSAQVEYPARGRKTGDPFLSG